MILNIITLPQREDRRALFERELIFNNIFEYSVWRGHTSSNYSFVNIRNSHQSIVKAAKYARMNEVLIAEDDFKLLGAGAYQYFLNNVPDDYDIYLGGIMDGSIDENNIVTDFFCGLTLYMVHERFYDKFLSIHKFGNLDRLLAGMGKFVVCNPMVVSQHGGYSDNKKQIVQSYDQKLIGRNLWRPE